MCNPGMPRGCERKFFAHPGSSHEAWYHHVKFGGCVAMLYTNDMRVGYLFIHIYIYDPVADI